MYVTAIFKMDNQQGPTIQHRELCSMLCGSLDGREVWGRMDTCIWMAEFPICSPETIITLLISHIPIQNKKLKNKMCIDSWQYCTIQYYFMGYTKAFVFQVFHSQYFIYVHTYMYIYIYRLLICLLLSIALFNFLLKFLRSGIKFQILGTRIHICAWVFVKALHTIFCSCHIAICPW